ncbi:collagen alpha-1(I) chain-like [Ornithorhynchus anatinus]|uniref:collagen alpha-1(I) chain-like n=1 Tax=Ornithorhynchus anatinus TaxID=9258 RepID=UPI0010A786D4|nr:collagen alpha-1(I) chain-like [Ornithorhynchus anatinus]
MADLQRSSEELGLPVSGSGRPPDDSRQRIDPEDSARSADAVASTSAARPGGFSGSHPQANRGRGPREDRKSSRRSGNGAARPSHRLEPRARAEQAARLGTEDGPAGRGRRGAATGPRLERGKPRRGPADPGADPWATARRRNRWSPQSGEAPGPGPRPPGRPAFPAAGNGMSRGAGRPPGPADLGRGGPRGDPKSRFLPAPREAEESGRAPRLISGRFDGVRRLSCSAARRPSLGSPPRAPLNPLPGARRPPLPTGKPDGLGLSGSVPGRRKPPESPRHVRRDPSASREGQRCLGAIAPFPGQSGRRKAAQEEAGPKPQPQPKPSLPGRARAEWREGRGRALPPSGSRGPTWQSNLGYLGGPVPDSVNSPFLLPFPLVSGLPRDHPSGFVVPPFTAAANLLIRCPQFPVYNLDFFCPFIFRVPCPLPKGPVGGETWAPPRAFPVPFVKDRPPRDRRGPDCELDAPPEPCSEQRRALERERRKPEAALAIIFPGKRDPGSDSAPGTRLPANPSHVDRLMADQLTERARVLTLVGETEGLRGSPVHGSVTRMLERHLEVIQHDTEADHAAGPAGQAAGAPRPGASRSRDPRGDLTLAGAVKELATSTRQARTSLWCALQMTLSESPSDVPANEEETERELQGLGP